ncbi:MAG: chemotaxis-specific protein-glutamate methyltransferase CheB [Isosphaeraceae bacterium]
MRIGIVNDMVMAREALRRVVLSLSEHSVAWMARDGAEAIKLARNEPPDLILMDLFMPGIDGVEATRRIMGESPCAILVVTSTISGHLSKVYQAMGYGALDAIETPTLGTGGEIRNAALLLHKIELIGRLVGTPLKATGAGRGDPALLHPKEPPNHTVLALEPLVVLGASTGGPQALAEIVRRLPPKLEAAVVVAQHVDAAFAPGLGQWLSEQAHRQVTVIADGSRPTRNEVLLAGTDDHLVLGEDRCLHYTTEPRDLCYRPSINVFFASVARNWLRPGVAALLTGMLRDGAEGLLALRNLGWRTIAQDEASSVVWGMPKAAVEIGAAEEVLPLSQIADAIVRLVKLQAGA